MNLVSEAQDGTEIKEVGHTIKYRAFVGPARLWGKVTANQFNVVTLEGLQDFHRFLDIGCGCLRGGRLFIMYLERGLYHGVEPQINLLKAGIEHELSEEVSFMKAPVFSFSEKFEFDAFEHPMEYLLAQSLFTHSGVKEMRLCLRNACAVMSEDAVFLATYEESEQPTLPESGWVYPQCTTFPFGFIESEAANAGLSCKQLDYPHPAGLTWVRLEKM
jgi:hypothetical protein